MNTQETVKSVTAGAILSWIFGIPLIIFGIIGTSVATVIAGIVLLPITSAFTRKYFNFNLSGAARFVLAIIIIVVGFTASNSISEVREKTATSEPAYDVPALVGMNLDQAREVLGTPSWDKEPTQLQISDGTTEWSKSWENERGSLMITYDIKSKKIIDFFISGDGAKTFKDTDNILSLGNLSATDNRYSVEFVQAKNAEGYTGATVTPR